jgi:hypothetical protein
MNTNNNHNNNTIISTKIIIQGTIINVVANSHKANLQRQHRNRRKIHKWQTIAVQILSPLHKAIYSMYLEQTVSLVQCYNYSVVTVYGTRSVISHD